jgi:hypothetical protein
VNGNGKGLKDAVMEHARAGGKPKKNLYYPEPS